MRGMWRLNKMIRLREGHHNPKLPLLVKTSSYIFGSTKLINCLTMCVALKAPASSFSFVASHLARITRTRTLTDQAPYITSYETGGRTGP